MNMVQNMHNMQVAAMGLGDPILTPSNMNFEAQQQMMFFPPAKQPSPMNHDARCFEPLNKQQVQQQ